MNDAIQFDASDLDDIEDGRLLCRICDDFYEEREGEIINGLFYCEDCQDKEEDEESR